jgi:hypothetical protein
MRIIAIILSVVMCFAIVTATNSDARESRTVRIYKPKRPPKFKSFVAGRAVHPRPVMSKRNLPPLDD